MPSLSARAILKMKNLLASLPGQAAKLLETARSDPRGFIALLLEHRWLRFAIVGFAATLSYFLLGLLFVNIIAFPVLAGNALAYLASFAVSYLGQSSWTFQASASHKTMLPKFAATQAIGLGINTVIIWLCAHMGLRYEISMAAAIVITPVFVYLICKYWVFPQGKGAGKDECAARVHNNELP